MKELLLIFKALSDPTRLRVIKLLEGGELCVCDIVAALDMIQPKVSFHLNVLKEAGLVKDRKAGRWIHYSIDSVDIFRRFLVLSITERITEDTVRSDQEKLADFQKTKRQCQKPSTRKQRKDMLKVI